MTDLRTAAQQALEVLIRASSYYDTYSEIDALRAALEQPEQEPMAWMVYTQDGKSVCVTDNPADFIEWRSFPLYTHPPRREWRGLTEKEAAACWFVSSVKTWKAIEAALRSKNHE